MSIAPPPENIWSDPRLAKGTLAKIWDSDGALRQRMHDPEFPHLTRWIRNPKNKQLAIGVPSVKAMALNATALLKVALWYCPCQPSPKAISIDVMRREVAGFRKNILCE